MMHKQKQNSILSKLFNVFSNIRLIFDLAEIMSILDYGEPKYNKVLAPQISSALKRLDSECDAIFLRGLNIYAAESITRNRHVTTVLYSYENYLKDKANKIPTLAIKLKINVLALENILFSEQEEPG